MRWSVELAGGFKHAWSPPLIARLVQRGTFRRCEGGSGRGPTGVRCDVAATEHTRVQHSTHPAQRMSLRSRKPLWPSGVSSDQMVARRVAVTAVRLLQPHGTAVCRGSGAITISSAACSSLVRPNRPQPNPSHMDSQRRMAQRPIARSSHQSYGVLRSVDRSALAASATRMPKSASTSAADHGEVDPGDNPAESATFSTSSLCPEHRL